MKFKDFSLNMQTIISFTKLEDLMLESYELIPEKELNQTISYLHISKAILKNRDSKRIEEV